MNGFVGKFATGGFAAALRQGIGPGGNHYFPVCMPIFGACVGMIEGPVDEGALRCLPGRINVVCGDLSRTSGTILHP